MLRLALACLLLIASAPRGAKATGEDSLALARDAASAMQRGNIEQAVQLYSEVLADPTVANDRRASLHNDRGVAYQRLNRQRAAVEDFNRAVQLFPEGASAYNNRGITLLTLGLTKEAVKDFDRALMLAPGYAAAFNNRANALAALGQTEAALRDYSKAIQLNPTSPAPLNGRARLHLAHNRPHAALRDIGRAIGHDARFGPGYRARAEAELLLERYEEAAEDLSRAVAFEPGNVGIYLLRGHAYLSAGNVSSALRDFDKAIELDPSSAAAYEARALANSDADAREDALKDLARAIELDPRSAVAFAYRAWVYKEMGQPELGQRDIERAGRLEPDRAEILWVQGELLEASGEMDQAIVDLKKALALKPALHRAVAALNRLGAASDIEESEVPELAMDQWQVYVRNSRYRAVNADYGRLTVPLEMMGEGQPRLLEWEVKGPPLKGIGVLRFSAGKVAAPTGMEEVEHAAVLDLHAKAVIAIEAVRRGDRLANWTWDENRLVVASVDGLTEEYSLNQNSRLTPQAGQRRVTSSQPSWKSGGRTPSWAPWAQSDGYQGDSRRYRPSRPQRPKSLFDLLFKN